MAELREARLGEISGFVGGDTTPLSRGTWEERGFGRRVETFLILLMAATYSASRLLLEPLLPPPPPPIHLCSLNQLP